MTQASPILALPYLMPSQAQKHVTHNEALQMLDALVQLSAEGFDAATPPAAPAPGETHVLSASPAGAWAGHPHAIAVWQGEGWLFLTPRPGWRAWGTAEQELRVWDGSAWVLPPADTQNLTRLGVGTAGDAANPLAVSGPATLLSHAGAGHQLKINKSASAETASLLFQSNWSGRAEIGLAGSNDFAVKLSDDGSSWSTALALKPNGRAGFGTASPAAHLEIRGSSDDYLLAGDGGGADFRLGSDGNGSCSGAWSGGGADYAEWFEWADGNPAGEDRRGLSVVLEGAKIRAANAGETPFGVISANPAVIGDGDMDGWKHRWLRDAYGALLRDADGNPQENPAYDASRAYVPREARPEWALTGLLGKLRLRQGQPAAPGWIRMRQAGPDLEEWLVR
ncbi:MULTISPECIES: DUF2793 domain-containing protein [unclassified Leisingera]|uniref:DUF2793 domain-containing protein n=1 Tax=unclassified Leisingera TaxID=2614906 RepID=UPI0002DC1DBA|nr:MULTISPECIES: DUF2793 domain-containing protein [unclassified Leisingera]KIC52578.1 hypothetical protein RA22_14920 [Leisingera sp. ANG-S]KID07514.1 hypothetical protein GC1_19015 [Leisingera sp. ANG1]